jgi:hypothetical protein
VVNPHFQGVCIAKLFLAARMVDVALGRMKIATHKRRFTSVGAKSPMQCAGINRHEAGNVRVLRERNSEPLGPEFCVGHREVISEA